MRQNKGLVALILVLVMGFVTFVSAYVVPVYAYAIVTQFGRVIVTQTEPGLYFRAPFIQDVILIDGRLREWDGEPSDLLTVDKENIEVNTWARWRVTSPRQYYEALRTESAGQGVLDGLVDSSVKNVISAQTLMEVLRNTKRRLQYSASELEEAEAGKQIDINVGREKIVGKILSESGKASVAEYGFEVTGVGIKQFNYVKPVLPKIYERMQSERIRIANRYESEGREREAKILGQMLRDLEEIESEGYAEATRIRGLADAEVLKTYAHAYGQDTDFYSFRRSLEMYPKAFNKGTRMVLGTQDSQFLKYIQDYR